MRNKSQAWSVQDRMSLEQLVSSPAVFVSEDPSQGRRIAAVLRRLPRLDGEPVVVVRVRGLRDRHGAVHAASFLRKRRIAFDCTTSELPRVFVHEVFHFVWLRAGNEPRRAFEQLLAGEWRARARGELGWSAEWRKGKLTAADVRRRSRRWREYCCESFCDTAAWLLSGIREHDEFTLPLAYRGRRRAWFRKTFGTAGLSI
jgi:hypothetical protein